MSNPTPPLVPLPDDDHGDIPTLEVDGDETLDTDIDDALVDSAEADRAASTGDVDEADDLH